MMQKRPIILRSLLIVAAPYQADFFAAAPSILTTNARRRAGEYFSKVSCLLNLLPKTTEVLTIEKFCQATVRIIRAIFNSRKMGRTLGFWRQISGAADSDMKDFGQFCAMNVGLFWTIQVCFV
jgi:hypothetical protein